MTIARTLAAGVALSVAAAAATILLGERRVGATDADALARARADVERRVSASEARLDALTSAAAADPALVRSAARDADAAEALFARLGAALGPSGEATTGISVYDVAAAPTAWAGRVIDVPRARFEGGSSIFMTTDVLGLRLVRVTPIIDRSAPGPPRRVGTSVAEDLLTDRPWSDVPVAVTPAGTPPPFQPLVFPLHAAGGTVLGSAGMSSGAAEAVRGRWRALTTGVLLAMLALTCAASVASAVDERRRRRGPAFVLTTMVIFGFVVGGGALASVAVGWLFGADAGSYRLFVNALTLVALVWLALDLAERWRLGRPRMRLRTGTPTVLFVVAVYFVAGAVASTLTFGYATYLRRFVDATRIDLLHFSLHPLTPSRTAISFALLLLDAGIVWAGAFALRVAGVSTRRPRRTWLDALAPASGLAGAMAAAAVSWRALGALPAGAAAPLAAMIICAAALSRPRGAFRRASQGARLALLFVALLLPALAVYPALSSFVTAAKERLVADTFAPQALNLRQELQHQSDRTVDEIDAMKNLPSLIEGSSHAQSPTTDQAYQVWSRTALAEHHTTSAIELYAANGRLVSRFALNLPEYTAPPHISTTCSWTTFEEVTSFAASDRHVLRASRGICTPNGMAGSIVVRVMLDYRTLPFISSQRPYIEALAPDDSQPSEVALGRDVELVIYGWSQAPLYSFSTGIWPLPQGVFSRLVASRAPFWGEATQKDGERYRVFFASDRGGIYALGFHRVTLFGHVLNLAELVVLTFVLWAALLGLATLFNGVTGSAPASGRALLREVRSSFYRKLWLAFVGATAAPVLILALATGTYLANQFNASVQDDAVRTATVAQRLVEDYAALQPRQGGTLQSLDDQVMILVSQAIDQDVNLFDPKRLQATSQPDLFASGILPLRTPDDVYRAVALDRLPTYVGVEAAGRATYLLAAARVRAGQREGIVTVPLTLRAREADQQIDNLDRRVLLASVLFVMLGAAVGYWMAERIADPVSRLTRATRRIARGELDARIAATSSDELRRLVEDFNRMAADLQRQRADLERTQRLEAWADMARQVAHDIKNPLTPIQLSAEHARRVNADRGRPLSPVLDDCVNAILAQVKLLRQIAAEFSSFASSPTARPEPTNIGDLIEQVIEPYRTGLAGRVALDVRTQPDMPLIQLDHNLFARALTNLVENALFAMPGGGTLTISSEASRERGVIRVTVADTGSGMAAADLQRIFEPYFSTKASGTGLGLTIAKRNIELNGGTIAVDSERGVGTSVVITLPIGAVAVAGP